MNARFVAVALAAVLPAAGHRVDEYLQATTISLAKDRIQAQLRLTPGMAVLPAVMTFIDTDNEGSVSPAEQHAYATRVLRDVSLLLDGSRVTLELVSTVFPTPDEMKEGLGAIVIDFAAAVPRRAREHSVVFENGHQKPIAAYLVNCLEPSDPDLQVTAQRRNYEQSHYELEYTDRGAPARSHSLLSSFGAPAAVTIAAAILLARIAAARRRARRHQE